MRYHGGWCWGCCEYTVCLPPWLLGAPGVGGWGSQRRHAVVAVRAPAVFGDVVDGGPAPGAGGTVAVVIEVTAAGASGSGVVDLSPLVATP